MINEIRLTGLVEWIIWKRYYLQSVKTLNTGHVKQQITLTFAISLLNSILLSSRYRIISDIFLIIASLIF